MQHARLYLRASTDGQDANRARQQLLDFAEECSLTVVATYRENESGAKLERPELFRLLEDSHPGDILLVEQVDRLSRLSSTDWTRLRSQLSAKGVRVVALDLPTSRILAGPVDEFTGRMFDAMNAMMLDVLAAVARKDYEDRRRRQAQGIEKAKGAGLYRGRRENTDRNEAIIQMLKSGQSWSTIAKATGCSRSTLSRLAKRLPRPEQNAP